MIGGRSLNPRNTRAAPDMCGEQGLTIPGSPTDATTGQFPPTVSHMLQLCPIGYPK